MGDDATTTATTPPAAVPAGNMFTTDQIGVGGDEQLTALIGILDVQARQPAVVRLRTWSLDALAVQPGETAVDIGSGTGSEVERLAALVGESGRAIGVEPNPQVRAEAERRAAASGSGAAFVDGSAAHLPFADGSVDVVRCERVFQHLEDPQGAAAEIARILAPGGRVALLDSDWGTAITHPGDPDVVRRYAQSGWQRMPNPFSGRHLANQLRAAGLEVDADIGSQALVMPPEALLNSGLTHANAEAAVSGGYLTRAEADTLVADLVAAATAGTAFISVTMFAVIARRPPVG